MTELTAVHRKCGHSHPDINIDSNLNNFKPVNVDEKRQVMIWHFSLAPY